MRPSFMAILESRFDLRQSGDSALLGGAIASLHEGHGSEIVASTDGRLGTAGNAVQQLSHGPRKCIGKPNLFPARREGIAGLAPGCEIDGAGLTVRIARPANNTSRFRRCLPRASEYTSP